MLDMPTPKGPKPLFIEHAREMALNRLAFGTLIAVYFSLSGARPALFGWVVLYLGFAIGVAGWLRWCTSRAERTILTVSMCADLAVLSVGLHLGGRANAGLFPIYLWVIQGNGFRFGLQALAAATVTGFASFAVVILTTAYWRDQPILALSLLVSLVVLPAYSSTLIRKLSRARLQAEEASRAKSMFLAAISHELRTPLNAILGSVSLVEDTPLDEEQHSLFQAMRSGTQALLLLIENILDFSRAEAGSMPVTFEALDLAALLVQIRDLVATQARLKSLQLSVFADPAVPLGIVADRKHLLEVLLNLAANSIKFTENGGVCLSVSLDVVAAGHPPMLRFEITDTGIGIAPEAQSRIFDVFAQADPTILDRYGGTGLGLAISRQLVTLMGGQIGVASKPGHGSTFWFTMPLREAEIAPQPISGSALLLCDDAAIAAQTEAVLEAQGLAVRRIGGLQDLGKVSMRPNGEVLFLYRRDTQGALLGDCAVLSRLDPRAALPRVLLCAPEAPALPSLMLRRHFTTTLSLPITGPQVAHATSLAVAAARPAAMRSSDETDASRARGQRQGPRDTETAADGGSPAGGNRAAARRLRILVADDNEINRRVIAKILERADHAVTLVSDGMTAMDALEEQDFDLVLMDVNMPNLNGLEATRLFRMGAPPSPRLPILALTADATAETERKCLEAGMDACITKPVAPGRLLEQIAKLVPELEAGAAALPAHEGIVRIGFHPRFPSKGPALERSVLDDLRALGGDEFVDELIRDFISDARALIHQVDRAVGANDFSAFRFELHALSSAAANVGAVALRQTAGVRTITQAQLPSAGRDIVHQLHHELACIEREHKPSAHRTGTSSG